jgi:hypothetical protein
VERLDHVMDVDGSQALAAEAVRRGGHVVIQGPPGTGKSQTISNIIAQAVLDGRSVLFVAEKLAALEVVKRRLESIGLGAACLELHSEKQSKRAVLDELRATLSLPMPPKPERDAVVRRLGSLRGRINRHAAAMRGTVGASGLALHQVIGALVALRQRGVAAPDFSVSATEWDAGAIEARRDAIKLLAGYAADGGAQSPWRGVMADIGPADADRLLGRLPGWIRVMLWPRWSCLPGLPFEDEAVVGDADVVWEAGFVVGVGEFVAEVGEPDLGGVGGGGGGEGF